MLSDDGMWSARSTDGGAHWGWVGCREGAGDGSIPEEHPHPQCKGLPDFGTVAEMYPNLLELSDVSCHDIAGIWVAFFSRCQRHRCGQGRLLLTFTVRCGRELVAPQDGRYWCNGTLDGHGLGLRAVLSTDRGQSWSFEHDRLVLLEQPFFPSPQPSGGGCARHLPLCLLLFSSLNLT